MWLPVLASSKPESEGPPTAVSRRNNFGESPNRVSVFPNTSRNRISRNFRGVGLHKAACFTPLPWFVNKIHLPHSPNITICSSTISGFLSIRTQLDAIPGARCHSDSAKPVGYGGPIPFFHGCGPSSQFLARFIPNKEPHRFAPIRPARTKQFGLVGDIGHQLRFPF